MVTSVDVAMVTSKLELGIFSTKLTNLSSSHNHSSKPAVSFTFRVFKPFYLVESDLSSIDYISSVLYLKNLSSLKTQNML